MELIDTHAHLDMADFDADRAAVIERARAAGVTRIICIASGGGFASARKIQEIIAGFPAMWAAAGVHPHDAGTEYDREELLRLAAAPRVAAIGETGLDYHYDFGPRERQERWFRLHIEAALELRKPLVVHSRDAAAECLRLLQELGAGAVGGVFHCYAEDAAFARELAAINFLVSFPGILTFKKALPVQAAAREIPLEQIMLETDAPYLAPEPHRGKRCEPAHVVETAQMLARLKNVPVEEVARRTTENALRLFALPPA